MSRTLNGLTGSSVLGLALIKPYNLADLTDISAARVNLGLVGTLTGGNNISMTPFTGTTNSTINIITTTSGEPNKILALDDSGNVTGTTIICDRIVEKTLDNGISLDNNDLNDVYTLNAVSVSALTLKATQSVKTNTITTQELTGTTISFSNKNLTNITAINCTTMQANTITTQGGNNISLGTKNLTNVTTINCGNIVCNSTLASLSLQSTGYKRYVLYSTIPSNVSGAGNFEIFCQETNQVIFKSDSSGNVNIGGDVSCNGDVSCYLVKCTNIFNPVYVGWNFISYQYPGYFYANSTMHFYAKDYCEPEDINTETTAYSFITIPCTGIYNIMCRYSINPTSTTAGYTISIKINGTPVEITEESFSTATGQIRINTIGNACLRLSYNDDLTVYVHAVSNCSLRPISFSGHLIAQTS